MRGLQVVGVLLILVGMLFVLNVFPLATVIYPEKFWYKLYPDGTSDNPTQLTPGSTITLTAWLVYFDTKTGVMLPGMPSTWIVQVDINGQVVTLRGSGITGGVENRYAVFVFQERWTVPNTAGVVYTLTWTIIIRDNNNNEVGRATTTTYAVTPAAEQPDGVFYINDKDASQTTTHIVFSPTLNLKFTATKCGDKITSVYVEVWQGNSKVETVTLSGNNPTWTATYTLPAVGTYTLKGFFTVQGSNTPIQKMSILANFGVSQQPPTSTTPTQLLSTSQMVGLALIIVGAVLALKKQW